MPTKTGKPYSTFYGNDLAVNQSSNTGIDATTRVIHDGLGQSTSISLSDDVLSVQPVNDNTTGSMLVKNQGGSNILAVDTTNSLVKVNNSQVNATTSYQTFSTTSADFSGVVDDKHYACQASHGTVQGVISIGTGTNPDTSVTVSSTADDLVDCLWYLPDAVTIDGVYVFSGADAATGDTLRFHLMSYAIDVGGTSTSGDLSSGIVLADGADITNAGYEQAYYQSMTIQSADVSAGRVILFTFRPDSINSDYSINARVKYHIQ
tara:strand:+ start:766 stop:1554 length:789 start_codon:yes stop_codon:yes gene_type:complete